MEENAVTALQLAGDEVVGLACGRWSRRPTRWSKASCSSSSWPRSGPGRSSSTRLFGWGRLRRKAQVFERAFWSGAPLDDLYQRLGRDADHPMAMLFAAAMEEWRDAPRASAGSGRALLERIQKVMSLSLDREIDALARHLSSLATIGATAPFVGLFGTVWGIMNSFQSIALTKNTTLAVVAPGIAEALLATALGLVAAIPAVVAYNKLSGDIDRYANRVANFADEFTVVLSRELDGPRSSTFDGSRAA